jgi:hypothetical protein
VHRECRVKGSRAAPETFQAFDRDRRSVEDAVDDCLTRMNAAALNAHLVRKHDELATTFVRCPAWAAERLPALAMAALRLELGRSLSLKSFTTLRRDSQRRRRRPSAVHRVHREALDE